MFDGRKGVGGMMRVFGLVLCLMAAALCSTWRGAVSAEVADSQSSNLSRLMRSSALSGMGKFFPANIAEFGADPTGQHDSTVAVQQAVARGGAVYVPSGHYLLTRTVMLRSGQTLFGDGRTASIFIVRHSAVDEFSTGVLALGKAEPGATVEDIGIEFTRETNGAAGPPFPAALYASSPMYKMSDPSVAAPARFQIYRVRVSGADICLDARGNTGGATVQNFECGALRYSMLWDGAEDWVHIRGYHFWPFGFPAKTAGRAAFDSGHPIAISFGRVDGLQADDIASFKGGIEFNENSTKSCCDININQLSLDSASANLSVSAGHVRISINGLSAIMGGALPIIDMKGGNVSVSNAHIMSFVDSSALNVSGGRLQIVGGVLTLKKPNQSLIVVSGHGEVDISSVTFSRDFPGEYEGILLRQSDFGVIRIRGSNFDLSGSGKIGDLKNPSIFSGNSVPSFWNFSMRR